MALTDNQAGTNGSKAAIKNAIAAKLEELFGTELTESQKDEVRPNWEMLAEAVAEALGPICDHITDNAEIGTVVVSDVDGVISTQSNTGEGLIH